MKPNAGSASLSWLLTPLSGGWRCVTTALQRNSTAAAASYGSCKEAASLVCRGSIRGRRRCGPRGHFTTHSGLDADDRVPVSRVLVGVRDPHEERVVEEAPDELHADRETGRRLAHGQSERRVAGVVEGLGVTGAAAVYRLEVVFNGLEVAARRVVLGRRHEAGGHHQHV